MDIDEVAEIVEMLPLRPLPNVPELILGVINLRGTVVPVIDLRVRFGLNRKSFDKESRILVMKEKNLLVGMAVDRMWELLRLPQESFQPPPEDVAEANGECFKEISEVDGRMLIVLDVKKTLH